MATSIVEHSRKPGRVPDLVRWGPVVAGVVTALGFFALMNVLWLALASSVGDPDGTGFIGENLGWFLGGTAAVALMLAGFLAGLFSGPRGASAGMANGLTAWGLLFVLSLTALVPGALDLTDQLTAAVRDGQSTVGGPFGTAGGGFTVESALWVTFWSLLVGVVLAALGGVLGGRLRRPVQEAAGSSGDPQQESVVLPSPVPSPSDRTVAFADNQVVDREPVDRTGLSAGLPEDARRRP